MTPANVTQLTIGEALAAFVEQLNADGRSEHTIAQFKRHIRLLDRAIGVSASSIAPHHLAAFLNSSAAKTTPDGREKRATSMNSLRSSLRMFFAFIHASGFIASNPARLIKRARCGRRPPRSISDADVQAICTLVRASVRAHARRDAALLTVLLDTGLRISSALSLDIEDVDFDRHEARIEDLKNDRRETIHLTAGALNAIRTCAGGRTQGAIFLTNQGERMSVRHARRVIATVGKMSGLGSPIAPHNLRHTFATRLLQQTGDLGLVQAALLHQSAASTMVYLTPHASRVRNAINATSIARHLSCVT